MIKLLLVLFFFTILISKTKTKSRSKTKHYLLETDDEGNHRMKRGRSKGVHLPLSISDNANADYISDDQSEDYIFGAMFQSIGGNIFSKWSWF